MQQIKNGLKYLGIIIFVNLFSSISLAAENSSTAFLEEKVGFLSSDPILFNQLIDDEGVRPQPIWGFLNLPKTERKKVPAVILMSGSGGIESWTNKYIKQLNAMGIATLQVDSYTPRGLKESVDDQSQLPVPMVIADAYAALRYLAKQPNIDAKHIAIIGWSLGGLVSLTTAFEDVNVAQLGHWGPRFVAHIAFYPACNLEYPDVKLDGSPWLYLHGGKDDYTQVGDCLSLINRVRASTLVKAVLYPNAYHTFDGDRSVHWADNVQNPKNCHGKLDKDWVATEETSNVTIKSQADFQKAYAGCMLRGAHLGYNKQASDDAIVEVTNFVRQYVLEIPSPLAPLMREVSERQIRGKIKSKNIE